MFIFFERINSLMLVVLRVKESPPFSWGIFILGASSLPSGMLLRLVYALIWFFLPFSLVSQTLGGSSTFQFLKLQQVPQAAALGGRNVSLIKGGIGMSQENPALLNNDHHGEAAAHFTFLAPSVTGLLALAGYHEKKTGTDFSLGISHLLYGDEWQTDAGGNVMGTFRSYDQWVAVTASRRYGERWRYGLTARLIQSRYGPFGSSGLAADAGLTYTDTTRRIRIGFSVKNMGGQLKTYNGQGEDMPFDMLLGISRQLEKAPLRFSLTAQRLNRFNILYNDTSFNSSNTGRAGLKGWGDQLISHLIIGTEVFLGDKIILSGGFNILRRMELTARNTTSGLTGFSYGLTFQHGRLNFQYARSHFQAALSHHLVSFAVSLSKSASGQK